MTFEQCNGNFNYMYEWRSCDDWYPCHIYHPKINENSITIFTRNGSITTESVNDVRKMNKEDYLNNREKCINDIGKYAYERGFHEDIEEDIRLFLEANELAMNILVLLGERDMEEIQKKSYWQRYKENMTEEQREKRRLQRRERTLNMTEAQKEAKRVYMRQHRANKTDEEREKERLYQKEYKKHLTEEQRQRNKEYAHKYYLQKIKPNKVKQK